MLSLLMQSSSQDAQKDVLGYLFASYLVGCVITANVIVFKQWWKGKPVDLEEVVWLSVGWILILLKILGLLLIMPGLTLATVLKFFRRSGPPS